MEILQSMRVAIKEIVLPELNTIREESREIKALLSITNKRLDDVNVHLADQSRRIDETNKRIDETNKRIDAVREELTLRIDETNRRIDDTNKYIGAVREAVSQSLSFSNQRLDTLYEVVVRRDDHFQLANRVAAVEKELADLKQKLAA